MIRKHVKVEPARWYYWCDQARPARLAGHAQRRQQHAGRAVANFGATSSSAVDRRAAQSSVDRHVGAVQRRLGTVRHREVRRRGSKELDPTRLVNNASGWTDRGVGDVVDMPRLSRPRHAAGRGTRAAVLGEFGGLGLPLEGHTWLEKGQLGLSQLHDAGRASATAYRDLMTQLRPADRAAACRPPSTRRRPTSRSKSTA